MEQAYQAHQDRRKNHSSANLSRLSLVPLSTKLPIIDSEFYNSDSLVQTSYSTSYVQGKSAPTTPSLLARHHVPPRAAAKGTMSPYGHGPATPKFSKSKSATTLFVRPKSGTKSGATTPGGYRRGPKKDLSREKDATPTAPAQGYSDWLLRAGVLISSETRESKGQSWLVSRASSTSLERLQRDQQDGDNDLDVFEKERVAREILLSSKQNSRRASLGFVLDDDESPVLSRQVSRRASRSQLVTPGERAVIDGYFAGQLMGEDEYIPGPDFVNLNEKLEAVGTDGNMNLDEESAVRNLVKSQHGRPHTWYGNIMGLSLFAVQENDDEDDGATTDDEAAEDCLSETSGPVNKDFGGRMTSLSKPQGLSPPMSDEAGWKDAAWLLSVASKVAWS